MLLRGVPASSLMLQVVLIVLVLLTLLMLQVVLVVLVLLMLLVLFLLLPICTVVAWFGEGTKISLEQLERAASTRLLMACRSKLNLFPSLHSAAP